jgi:hypothetical protein
MHQTRLHDNEVTNTAYIADLACGGLIAEILGAQVVLASENPTGAVSNG